MKHLVSISFGSSRHNFDERIHLRHQDVRITHLGSDFDMRLFKDLLKSYDGHCDGIALSYIPAPIRIGKKIYKHEIYQTAEQTIKSTPVSYGFHMRSILLSWILQRALETGHLALKESHVLFLNGISILDIARLLEAHCKKVSFLDPWIQMRIPKALHGIKDLERYAQMFMPFLRSSRIATPEYSELAYKSFDLTLKAEIRASDLIVTTAFYLENFDLSRLKDKTLLVDYMTPTLAQRLKEAAVYNCYYMKPQIDGVSTYNYAIAEGLLGLLNDADSKLGQEEILEYLGTSGHQPVLYELHEDKREPPRKFAFIIHPLSLRDLYRHPLLRPLNQLPKSLDKTFERVISRVPGVAYGRVMGVKSEANGVRAEGLLYTLFATPREMLRTDAEVIYDRILDIAKDAQARGAKIIGLGAFTKIVGDAGVTVAGLSPIPVTTGNSLSAAATLWAAREACTKMGFITAPKQKGDKISGCCMIIGATGSIGKACAKVLAELFDTLIVAATHGARLMELQFELREMEPSCQVKISTNPDKYAGSCDLIVIATSALEGGVLSIESIKPGCVVCDVSRPLTYSAAEATSRPDVLIIESGEIELPGQVTLDCDIGLEKSVVYACLAETALLALEGRYESFTLSRNINYKKVKEIYQMARKHGARLAEIRSPTGVITDQEIDLCREHALKALKGDKK